MSVLAYADLMSAVRLCITLSFPLPAPSFWKAHPDSLLEA
jgi:hypothetical protein